MKPTQRGLPIDLKSLGLAVGAVLISLPLSGAIKKLGANIPSHALLEGHIQATLIGALLAFSILLWPSQQNEKKILLMAWGIKLCVVLGAMLFYENNYLTLDAYSYYAGYGLDPGSAPRDHGYSLGIGTGTANITLLTQFIKNSFGLSYHAIKLLYAYAGFAACWITYRAGALILGRSSFIWLCVMLLTPSMLFWTGILGKDPLVVLGIALYIYGSARYFKQPTFRNFGWAITGIVLASVLRLWMALVFVPPLVFLFACCGPKRYRGALAFGAAITIVIAAIGLAAMRGVTSPSDIVPMLAKVSQQWAEGGSAQKIEIPFTSIGGLVAFIPLGAFTALYRPLPLEVSNAFGLLAGMENLCLLAFSAYVFIRKGFRLLKNPFAVFLLICLICWCLLYSLISFQNLGTASRFKVQALPFLLLFFWTSLAHRPDLPGDRQ